MTAKINLDERIFWDVDFTAINYHNDAKFVIERVFGRGDVADIRSTRRYYGDDVIIGVLLQAKYIPINRLHLISAIYNKPLTDFSHNN